MSSLRELLLQVRRSLRERPDELLREVGAGGELLLARVRLLLALLILLMPITNALAGGQRWETLSGAAGALLVLVLSRLWLVLAQSPNRPPWLPFWSAAFDVSAVSLVLVLLGLSAPVAALNSTVVWACYPLAIFATVLRHDVRVTLLAGGLAIVQTAALWAWFTAGADAPLASADYGTVSASTQLQRLVLLVAVTLLAALTVFRAQYLTHLAGTDGLTGLPNRSFLGHRVPALLAEARATNRSLSLALVDLDHFRRINAELGHAAGDRALRHAVKVLRLELGRDEPMIRVGGEEFVLLLRRPLGAAWERVEQLRRRLEAEPFVPDPGHEPRVLTFSAGIAAAPQDANGLSGLMKRADQRLRIAKAGGRNRVVARDDG